MRLLKIAIPMFMVLTILLSGFSSLINTSESINNKVFRLHILANSNDTSDQDAKLKVRDYLLNSTAGLFSSDNLEDKIENANENSDKLAEMITEYLKKLGYNYQASVNVVKEYFDTRVYDDFTLPAGIYNSLKITLGKGEGHNWWCIIFPQVCISACSSSMQDYLSNEELELINSGYSPKFKIVEIYEKVMNK